MSRGRR